MNAEREVPDDAGTDAEGPAEHIANALQMLQISQFDVPVMVRHDVELRTVKRPVVYGEATIDAVIARLHRALRQLRAKGNPVLALVNPPPMEGRPMADAVYQVAYRHSDDGQDYVHDFEQPDRVRIFVETKDRVLLVGDGIPIIGMFPPQP